LKEEFFRRFIEEDKYLQNPPMNTDKFIKFCKGRGITTTEDELEFFEKEGLLFPIIRIDRPIGKTEYINFEKDGKMFRRRAEYCVISSRNFNSSVFPFTHLIKSPIFEGFSQLWDVHDDLKNHEKEISRYTQSHYSSYGFDELHKDSLRNWLECGNLFNPEGKSFQKWSSFEGEKLMFNNQKIISFYSSFQIYWLDMIKNCYSLNINLSGNNIEVCTFVSDHFHRFISKGCFEIQNFEEIITELNKVSNDVGFENYFNFEKKKSRLKKDYKYFEPILEFLLSIQNVYTPYGKSSARNVHVSSDPRNPETWEMMRMDFDPKKELEILDLDIRNIASWYQLFSKKSMELLGGGRYDWMQIWKNIRWFKKDKLEGNIKLGIEYLGWALIFKRFIEDYLGRDVLDIDEVHNVLLDSILEVDPSTIRGRDHGNYCPNLYKKLFYLSNSFGLYYQPRVMVFVEGYTEEVVLPRIFKFFYDIKPEDHGIEFVNFDGVDKLLSTSKIADDLRSLVNDIQREMRCEVIPQTHRSRLKNLIDKLNNVDIIISNWEAFISYNIEKWQIIPFFISDNEGNIKHFLEAETPIKFNDNRYNVPKKWRFLWGIDNDNKPLRGYSFELANFADEEIASAINELLNTTIDPTLVQNLRNNNNNNNNNGINKLNGGIHGMVKIGIAEKLVNDLFNKYNETKDNSILERPVFKVIEKIAELEALNHPPFGRQTEIENKKTIEQLLKNNQE